MHGRQLFGSRGPNGRGPSPPGSRASRQPASQTHQRGHAMTTYIVAFEGRLAADPELDHTPDGTPVCNALVLVNHRVRDAAGEWTDGEPSRRYIKAWRGKAERLATLTTGTSVVVIGTAHTETWNHHETGEKRTREVVDVESIGQGV